MEPWPILVTTVAMLLLLTGGVLLGYVIGYVSGEQDEMARAFAQAVKHDQAARPASRWADGA